MKKKSKAGSAKKSGEKRAGKPAKKTAKKAARKSVPRKKSQKPSSRKPATRKSALKAPSAAASKNKVLNLILAKLDEDQAANTIQIDLHNKSTIADYMVVTSGRSNRHVNAIADHVIESLIVDRRTLEVAEEAARIAYAARSSIHDQFAGPGSWKALGYELAWAASIATALFLGIHLTGKFVTKPSQPLAYEQFLLSLPPTARNFDLECSMRQIRKAIETGDDQYIKRAWSFDAARAEWGDGP